MKKPPITKKEVLFLVNKCEAYGIRFTLSHKVISKDPITDEWETLLESDVLDLLEEWYIKGKKHNKHLVIPHKRVRAAMALFTEFAFDAVHLYDQDKLEQHVVSNETIEVEKI